ncbi:MAG TPA: potassium-transporting ATPase subunit KdpA [Dehalococcoidia bacterium]|nr:potassium-transporting ATPase subunit KdpA [Dehalococcoidia bacterium]
MTGSGVVHILLYFGMVLALTKPLGAYMAAVFEGEGRLSKRVFAPVERVVYRAFFVDETSEMDWKRYALSVMMFSAISMFAVYAMLRLQGHLPLNPQNLPAAPGHLAFNTAASFTTNTNWQSYAGESTMSYLSQMLALTVQNFVSAAVGIAVVIVLIRGFARRSTADLGNFWVDLTRCILWILLPLSIVLSLVLVSQGVIQNFSGYREITTLEGAKQVLAMGPAASQVAIKQLGTNGGGFFNANSATPFENPTPFSNFVEAVAILLIPAALTHTFGKMMGDTRQGWAIFAAMSIIFLAGAVFAYGAEQTGNPTLASLGVDQAYHTGQQASSGGNMEGKEVRLGIADSAIWAVATTDASNGSVNSMHDSYTPLGGLVPLFNIHLGEIVFGGVGSGLYGMLVFAIIAVFVAGLMIGRTPEYLGKKIGPREMKLAAIYFLVSSALMILLTAVAVEVKQGVAGPLNAGAHGYTEILYAFSSAGGNNGSAFAGLNANTPFYDTSLGISMLIARFVPLIAILALAGSLGRQRRVPESAGTLPTNSPLFVGLLVGVVIIVAGLTFFPALALGPIAEHFLVHAHVLS